MKFLSIFLAASLLIVAHSTGAVAPIEWPKDATIEVELKLSSAADTNGYWNVSGDLLIRNPGNTALTIQNPENRLALAFLVFDSLGNPVAPKGIAKVDPFFSTKNLSARSTYTHHFETLAFITGSALFDYELSVEKTYKVLAVYRPAGWEGPGFATQEVPILERTIGKETADKDYDEHPVTKTLKIKVPGKVDAVFWSVKSDLCVVQITFPSVRHNEKEPSHSRTQVWLLKSDGTVIAQKQKPSSVGISMSGFDTYSVAYTFPPSARVQAVAVVVSIDDEFFVEPLSPKAE